MMPAPHTWGEGDVLRITDVVKLIVPLSAVSVHSNLAHMQQCYAGHFV